MSKSDVFEFIREYVNENKPEGVYKIFLTIKEPIGEKEIYQISPIYIVEDNSDLLDIHYTNKSKTQWYTTGDSVFRNFENEIGKFIRKYLSYDVYFKNRGVTSKSYWLKEKIKEGLKEVVKESEDDKELLKSMVDDIGLDDTIKYIGGVKNYINVMYDGDLANFAKENNITLVYISQDGLRLYINDLLVRILNLPSSTFLGNKEKELGKFRYGTKNHIPYAFNAKLVKTKLGEQDYWKVIGTSGDFGFGYSFITKRNTMGKRHRQQIYKQIIDKYDLEKYM